MLTDRSVVCIPHNIPIDKVWTRFSGAMWSAASKTISRGNTKNYVPCMSKDASTLLKKYEETGDQTAEKQFLRQLDTDR